VQELLDLAATMPRVHVAAGEHVLVDGEAASALYVLLDGSLRVEKAGLLVARVDEPGACVGEMSLLLGVPVTADVVAAEDSVLVRIDDATARLDSDPRLALVLARLLATRLQVMTTYLADLKRQYADHEGGLGMVDTVLGALMRSPGRRSSLGSERDPDPEY
jgi:CRP/FNR family cyclic AMP-dependent transcriptional regulator